MGVRTIPSRMEKHKAVDFLMKTGSNLWKRTKLPMLGHHRTASEAPFKWRFAGGLMVVPFGYWVYRFS